MPGDGSCEVSVLPPGDCEPDPERLDHDEARLRGRAGALPGGPGRAMPTRFQP